MSPEARRHLFLLSIGPVQPFIQVSRKSQDLWAGSELLSEFARTAAEALLKKEVGARMILPPSTAIASDAPIANKILVLLPVGVKAADAAGEVRKALCARLKTMGAGLDGRLSKYGVTVDGVLWTRQTERFLEIAWAAKEVDGSDIGAIRNELELALDGRKRLRDFEPYVGHEGRRKSSLDGAFEGVLEEKARQLLQKKVGEVWFGTGEQLDAMGLLRRFHPKRERWPSVSAVAVRPFVDRMKLMDRNLLEATEVRRNKLNTAAKLAGIEHDAVDSDWSFLIQNKAARERLLKKTLDDVLPSEVAGALESFEKAVEVLLDAGRRLDVKPSPYYAFFSADGDHMGARLGNCTTEMELTTLAGQVSAFASRVLQEYQAHEAVKVIYAGGDDVLGFCAMDEVPNVVRFLFDAFGTSVRDATLSIGMAISHARDSMREAIQLSQRAQREAKDRGGDRCCLWVSKRSGGDTRVVLGREELDDPFVKLARALRAGDVPHGFAYEVRRLGGLLADVDDTLRKQEFVRILRQKRAKEEWRDRLAGRLDVVPGDERRFEERADDLVSLLIVASNWGKHVQPDPSAGPAPGVMP